MTADVALPIPMNSRLRFLLTLTVASLTLGQVLAADSPTSSKTGAKQPPAQAPLDPKLPTLWVAGDSTAAPGGANSMGWGVPFPSYFDLAKINVANRARGGRSSRTFITDGSWDNLLQGVKAGDIVLIQFGHNDSGATNTEPPGSSRPLRARGSLPGLGEETEEIDNVITKKHEVVYTFGHYLRKMIADTKAKGATPILLSLTIRNSWKDGQVERGGKYGEWSAAVAKSEGVEFIDLSKLIANDYERRGMEAVKAFFPNPTDQTHTGPLGADNNAALVLAGMRALSKTQVDKFLSAKGRAVAASN